MLVIYVLKSKETRILIYVNIISQLYTTKAFIIPMVTLRNPRKSSSDYIPIGRRLETMELYYDINSIVKNKIHAKKTQYFSFPSDQQINCFELLLAH